MAQSKFHAKYWDADRGKYNAEFEAFYAAVGQLTDEDYDGKQVCDALGAGMTPQECVDEIVNPTAKEDREDFARIRGTSDDYEHRMDHDYSMNG